MSKDILNLLDTIYPGHAWACRVYGDEKGGGYFIYLLSFEGKNYGYNQPRAHRFASASELRADVIRGAGEVLERSYLARHGKASWDVEIKKMDGVPLKDQPLAYQKEVGLKRAAATAVEQLEKEEAKNAHGDELRETITRGV